MLMLTKQKAAMSTLSETRLLHRMPSPSPWWLSPTNQRWLFETEEREGWDSGIAEYIYSESFKFSFFLEKKQCIE